MTKLRRILILLLVLCVTVAGVFAQSGKESSADEKKSYRIGICQLVQHSALDAATQGFMDTLKKTLGEENVSFDYQNASGDASTVTTIINSLVSNNVDLILANATLPLQTAAAATENIPILGTSITDYGTALAMKLKNNTTGINVSGASDLAPLDRQVAMIAELFPDAKKIGLLYCSGEPNSLYQIEQIEKYLDDMGLLHSRYAFTDSNDVSSVTESACRNSDVIYIPTDNTAASCTEAIRNVTETAKTPVIAGEEGICKGCGVATLTISYYDLGCTTGRMAYEILKNGAAVSSMPIRFAENPIKKYNSELAQLLGVVIPSGYTEI